jgi:hypothetical protein
MRRLSVVFILSAVAFKGVAAQAIERDSAGVRIVTQPPSARVKLGRPVLQVDGAEGGREPFFRLSGDGITAHSDGFVVANAGTELRFYSAAGELRKTAGGRGSGPGEFQIISWLQRIQGDSIAVYDSRLRRLSVWTRTGERARETPVPGGMMPPAPGAVAAVPAMPTGALHDGLLLFTSSVSYFPSAGGIARASGWLLRGSPTESKRDTIASIAVIDYGPLGSSGPPLPTRVAFMRMLRRSVTPDGFALTEGDAYQIEQYDPAGQRTSIRVRRSLQPVRADHVAAWKAKQPGANAVFPNVFPAYSNLFRDRAGRLWAELFPLPDAATSAWDVFDPKGRLLATVEVPVSVELVTADATRVYGIHTDDLDVQTIQVFEIPTSIRR